MINIVDLAGSEMQNQAGTTSDRLAEIEVQADHCVFKYPKAVVHYRDSKLTMTLKDALCGNIATIMIA